MFTLTSRPCLLKVYEIKLNHTKYSFLKCFSYRITQEESNLMSIYLHLKQNFKRLFRNKKVSVLKYLNNVNYHIILSIEMKILF